MIVLLAQASLALAATPAAHPNLDLWDAGDVFDVVADGNNGFYVGGTFSQVAGQARANLARIRADGSLDPDFSPMVNNSVYSIVRLADGSIIIGGLFTHVNDLPRASLAKIDSNGVVDANWNPGSDGYILRLLSDGAGHVYLGGSFSTLGGQARANLARVNDSTGAVDPTWAPSANNQVYALALTSDGKLWVGGQFTTMNGAIANRAIRLSATGANDLTLNVNGTVYQIQVDSQDRAYLCGIFNTVNGATRFQVARVTSAGVHDAWGPPVNNLPVFDCELNGDELSLAGAFSRLGANDRHGIARLRADGTLDPDFAPATRGRWMGYSNSNSFNWVVRQVTASQVVIGGTLRYVDDQPRAGMALVSANDASPAAAIDAERTAVVYASTRSGDGWLIGGSFWRAGVHSRENLLRLDADGELDTAWDVPVNGQIRALLTDEFGAAYIGGFFNRVDTLSRDMLFKLDDASQAAINGTWVPRANGAVTAMYSDSRLYVGGVFTSINGATRNRMARLQYTGNGAPDGYHPNIGNGQVNAITQPAVSFDIYVGGSFTQVQGTTRNRLAVFDNGNSATLSGINPSFNGTIWALAAHPTQPESIYVGGDFTQVGATSRPRLAWLDTTVLSPTWNPGADGSVLALAPDTDGNLFVGGNFSTLGGHPTGSIGKVDAITGAIDTTYQADTDQSPRRVPLGLRVREDGLFAIGNFTRIAGANRRGVALLSLDVLDTIFANGFEITGASASPPMPPADTDYGCRSVVGRAVTSDARMTDAIPACADPIPH